MKRLVQIVAAGAVFLASSAPSLAGKAVGDMHPEEAYPDNLPRMYSPGPHADFIKAVQQKLRDEGFDPGPVNGDLGPKTQAALVQFQLANTIPASGALDGPTLVALDVPRPETTEPGSEAASGSSGGEATSGAASSR